MHVNPTHKKEGALLIEIDYSDAEIIYVCMYVSETIALANIYLSLEMTTEPLSFTETSKLK